MFGNGWFILDSVAWCKARSGGLEELFKAMYMYRSARALFTQSCRR